MKIPISFSKVFQQTLLKQKHFRNTITRHSNLWEPDYLIMAKTKTPEYDLINFHMKGYDFAVLENYQSLIHKIAGLMGIDVENAWASPHQDLKVQRFIPNSAKVDSEYNLKMYERTLQVIDAKSNIMSLFIEAVMTTCPPGVKVSINEHTTEIEENRYVPDYEVIELQKQWENLNAPKK
ncbi:hypothetical protein RUM44_011889 [Polyplax serrata]|uniref:Small ribosomal subunit protein uS10 domain-containing protein n=1 Tax=Polyplax serrata TaxID=468196 RepID=A0ABR1B9R5_POLSC